MIEREISGAMMRLVKTYPVVTVTGPRQSGKTTLCRSLFPEKRYVNLESVSERGLAQGDPHAFASRFPEGAVIDEVQRVPELLSEIQVEVDENPAGGRFILTGSRNFDMMAGVSQSLAGRTALLKLLPFSYREIASEVPSMTLDDIIFTGAYPRIYDRGLNPSEAASFYVSTYIERDVRSILNVKDLRSFELFIRVCAGRTGQIANTRAISDEIGISHNTVKQWLSVLEESYIIRLVQPYFANVRKRLIKSPKLYFLDTGIVCFLLGIQNATQVATHPLRGALFETFVFSEILKSRFNSVLPPNIYFYRDQTGIEVDFILDYGIECEAVEVKSAQRLHPEFFRNLLAFAGLHNAVRRSYLIYGGEETLSYAEATAVPWKNIAAITEWSK